MKKTISNLEIPTIFFLALMIVLGIVTFNLFTPYFNIIIISLIIVQIFHPFYKFVYSKTKSAGLSTLASIIVTLVCVIIPLVLILLLTINEIKNISDSGNLFNIVGNLEGSINETIRNVNANLLKSTGFELSQLELRVILIDLATSLRNQLLPVASQILSLSGEILFNLFLLVLSLSYLFPLFDNLPKIFKKVSPLDDEVDSLIFEKLRQTTKGVLKGTLIVAIIQATAVLIPLMLMGVGAPVLLWLLMVLLSIVPIGSGLVWAPVGVAIIIGGISSGNSTQIVLGILLIIYSAIIINVIDTTFRPRLMKGAVNIHPLAAVFSVLGGIALFGVLGILYGPVLFVLFLTLVDIYRKNFLSGNRNHEITTA